MAPSCVNMRIYCTYFPFIQRFHESSHIPPSGTIPLCHEDWHCPAPRRLALAAALLVAKQDPGPSSSEIEHPRKQRCNHEDSTHMGPKNYVKHGEANEGMEQRWRNEETKESDVYTVINKQRDSTNKSGDLG